jgi:ubiquinone/menaquinone biosynthesis C-methylase UbiE
MGNLNWEKAQKRTEESFTRGENMINYVNTSIRIFSDVLEKYLGGKTCLDIGCGIWHLPKYMELAPSVKFTGIDPVLGGERDFPFKQAYAEELPFKDKTFDGVCFAGSLNIMKDINKAVIEATRVIKDNGIIIIYSVYREDDDPQYIEWQKNQDYETYGLPYMMSSKTIKKIMVGFKNLEESKFSNKILSVWQKQS